MKPSKIRAVDAPEPDPDESQSDFMDRCRASGATEAQCQQAWGDEQEDQQDDTVGRALGYPHILEAVTSTPWAILSTKLAVIMNVLAMRAAGHRLSREEIRERIGARHDEDDEQPAYRVLASSGTRTQGGAVAVIPLQGTLAPRAGAMAESSGVTGLERWTSNLRSAIADPSVGSVVIDIDSPGGSVFGVQETFDAIRALRGGKPIVAVANSMAASAAYWLASAADELVVTPSGEVGSIGVIAAHEDLSAALDRAGVKVSLITAGKYKAEGSPFEPLSAETREFIQSRVDDYYGMFTRAVARGRGTTATAVRDGYGQGRMLGSQQAVQAGMADRVGTLEDTVSRLARGTWERPQRGANAMVPVDGMEFPAAVTIGFNQLALSGDIEGLARATQQAIMDALQPAQRPPSLDLQRRRMRRRGIPAAG
jgi:signal peptide peptidase SppA